MAERNTRITVLISGSGTNLQALIDGLPTSATIVRVISNKKDAYGLKRAEKAEIPTAYHNLIFGKYLKSGEKDKQVIQEARNKYDAALADLVLEDKPDLVVCAGWMHILAPSFIEPLNQNRVPIINLHPALPTKYDGAGAIRRAYEDFQNGVLENNTTGVMIHYVIKEVDRGDPILVEKVVCREGETLDELETRMHSLEHELIVRGTVLAIENLWKNR